MRPVLFFHCSSLKDFVCGPPEKPVNQKAKKSEDDIVVSVDAGSGDVHECLNCVRAAEKRLHHVQEPSPHLFSKTKQGSIVLWKVEVKEE